MIETTLRSTLRIFLLVTFCIVLIGTTTPAFARPTAGSLEAEVDAYITETMKRLPIPGIAVGIVKGDQVLYIQGYGIANTDGDPVTPQTPFPMASVTKTFTALAVQQLANAGKLSLDQPVQTYLPEFQLADKGASTSITVRHLLDHTSGITTIEGTQPYLHSPDTMFDEALKQLAHSKPGHTPGEQFEYSNWNYILLGEIISRTSGQPYVEYMQKNILDPLEMSHSTFADHHTLPNAATGNLIVFGASVPYDEPYLPVTMSAGHLASTVEDMTHYLVTFFNHGQYNGHDLLPSQALGWYDTSWNWHVGMPDDISYGFSGGHNSINTNIQLFSFQRVGVVVLMNTRLDQLIPGSMVNDIAFNIARITIGFPHEVPSNRRFYGGYALLDGFLLVMVVSIIWQASTLKNWEEHYHLATRAKRIVIWLGIIIDLLVCIAILVLPLLLGSRWNIIFHFRPDFAIPILTIGTCLGALGLIKIFRSR
jgi:CubicO group peptidase (beta-lactamase class C family)